VKHRDPFQLRFLLGWLALVLAIAFGSPSILAAPPQTRQASAGTGGDVGVDRSTPRRTLESFLEAARDADFSRAALCLDLQSDADRSRGSELAEELSYVLYRRAAIDLAKVPDDPSSMEGPVTVDTFSVREQEVPLQLARVRFDDGIHRWLIARTTVRRIPEIAATYRSVRWEDKLPSRLRAPVVLGNAPWQWGGILLSLLFAYAVGRAAAAIAVRVGGTLARRTTSVVDAMFVEAARRPLRTIFASTAFAALVFALQTSLTVARILEHVAYTGFVVGLAWLLLAVFNRVARLIAAPYAAPQGEPVDGELDPAGDRTRRALLQRVASALIVVVTIALLLLQFDVVRHVGLSLLASAGILGVVVGLAAQKSLAGLIAGIQLSITQPVRLGDTLFLEGELGLVEDIFLTYAVVRFWDDRTVVVPLSRFLEQPFQNWTLLRRELSAVVLLHVKFTAPIDAVRAKVRELCESTPAWDRRACDLTVSDSDMYGMVLRAVVSARSPKDVWVVRCAVREGLIKFLQTLDGGVHLG
jgi:small-conductance mechanosensitive channel